VEAFFWLLYGIAAAFPLRSLHSPFKSLGGDFSYGTSRAPS